MSRFRTWVPLAVLVAVFGLRCGSSDTDTGKRMHFGHVGAPGSLFALSADELSRRVNSEMAGSVQIQVFGSSQLGGDESLIQKLKLGTVQLALPSTVMSSLVPEFGLFEMPWLIHNREHMRRVEQEVFWPDLAPAAERAGLKILAVWENGFRHITNNVRPVARPADLEGIKLRTPRGIWRVRMFESLGANPTPMPLSEVFMALQTGVMDGQENPFTQTYTAKFHEVQKFLSLTYHVYTPAYLTTGLTTWNGLDAGQQKSLTRIAREVQSYVYREATRLDTELKGRLEEAGLQVNEVERSGFVERSRTIFQEFAETVEGGDRLIERVLSLADPS